MLTAADESALCHANRLLDRDDKGTEKLAGLQEKLSGISKISLGHSHQNIDFAVTTVARTGDYIHQLITSLPKDLRLHLVVGAPESEYLEPYRSDRRIEIMEAPPPEWEHFRESGIQQRAAWNYWRTLVVESHQPDRKGLVILEDDVIAANNWERRLYRTIEQIERCQPGPYILALYAPGEVGLGEPEQSKCFVSYPADSFFGLQAMYYPEAIRQGFATYLKQNALETFRIQHDFLLGEYARKEKIPIFAAIPCLFQHIGEVSTGLAQFFHQAHRFHG